MRRLLGLLTLAVLAGVQPAYSQDPLDVREGRAFAQRICATCHGIGPGEQSRAAGALNFQTLAVTIGVSELALRVTLDTPHHAMPNLVLTADEKRDVIAYIMSLRPRN